MFRAVLCCPTDPAYPLVLGLDSRESPEHLTSKWVGVLKRYGLCCQIALRPITFGTHWEHAGQRQHARRSGIVALAARGPDVAEPEPYSPCSGPCCHRFGRASARVLTGQ